MLSRLEYFDELFYELEAEPSRAEKLKLIATIPTAYYDDFIFCLEILDGRHKLGYTLDMSPRSTSYVPFNTVREMYEFLQEPLKQHDLSQKNIQNHLSKIGLYYEYVEPIFNRKWKLGIGPSLLEKKDTSPMLAKKYEGTLSFSDYYTITEKLDGNRCIAKFNGKEWEYISRNGKPMNVDFDMSGFPTCFIYDGEVLSKEQVEMSEMIYEVVNNSAEIEKKNVSFNKTSGLINRHTKNKNLVYNIFDIMNANTTYVIRRQMLEGLRNFCNSSVRILPVLDVLANGDYDYNERLYELRDKVVDCGGEGIMINDNGGLYQNKRTNLLMKFKPVKSMDMKVIDTFSGEGKYEGMCGGLICKANDGNVIVNCRVGTGLKDYQREQWIDKNKIVGKIVEVEYFDLSQNINKLGTKEYSLRFPRLKNIRDDKTTTSIY